MTWIADAIAALKLPPKVVARVAFPSAFLVLAPDNWIAQFGLTRFMELARPYVALVFLVSTTILVIELVLLAKKHLSTKSAQKKARDKLTQRVHELDPPELIVLREFALQGQSTIKLPLDQPVVAGLIQKGVLRQVGNLGERTLGGTTFSFRMHEIASEIIDLDMLGLPENPTEDQERQIVEQRPTYMRAIQDHERIFHSPTQS